MSKRIRIHWRWLAAFGATATLIAGCASTTTPEPATEPAIGTGSAEKREGDLVLEEVVVTSNRAGAESQAPQGQAMAAPGPRQVYALSAFNNVAGDALPYEGDEEIWVIQAAKQVVSDPSADEPGSGAMLAVIDTEKVPLPLRHTDVKAQINGYISSVNVRQEFSNPFDSKIEAVYMFPLPEKAAITEFLMVIGDRKIRGILREKEEARAIYEAARSQGYRASLLVQHRPNIFEQKVANIEPGKSIDVDIKYFHTLAYNDGWYSFVLPTVVGPRYNPPESSDPVLALPRSDTGSSGTAVRYLRPEERSAHDLEIEVQIDAGVAIEDWRSSHEIATSRPGAETTLVRLAGKSTIPNRDFVLDFKVAGNTTKSDLLTYVDPESQQGYFTLMLYPPEATDDLARQDMEMVFVIDTSGSMRGKPIEQAKDAVRAALDRLQPGDTFQIIRFSDNTSQFGRTPVPATKRNLERARQYLANLSGGGGTQMIEGVRAALDFPHDRSRLRFVSFLTDGYIGNETDILAAVGARIGSSRVFSFGVGSSVNRYLMERMAKAGRGAVAYLGPTESGREVMDGFFNRISHPALTDVRIDWQGMSVSDVYPAALPDLFVGRPVVVTGKYQGVASDVAVLGRHQNRDHRMTVESNAQSTGAPYLAKIWARMRIAELTDRQAWGTASYEEVAAAIKATALEYQLMSDYTSFVAVDASQRTEGEFGTTVHQAVPVPDGVRYDTTVNENQE